MRTSDFDYHLPEELVAQEPASPRDSSRLMVLKRNSGELQHRLFSDIADYLAPGDVLVANRTRVIPARMFARKVPTGGKVELLLLRKLDAQRWESLVTGRRAMPGQEIVIDPEGKRPLHGWIEAVTEAGGRIVRFEGAVEPIMKASGEVPLPPYIHRALENEERYQTVYSKVEGSVAAPTAGLHFTPELIQATKEKGVVWADVVLHIGLDTFRPVTEERVEEHQIHREYCRLTAEAAETINRARKRGGRVIAVGTTSVRVLETAAEDAESGVAPWQGETELFIYPGYRFRVVDGLITNFHLPRSSLLMLVSAFASLSQIRDAYQEAVRREYRFYSFGDAMLIL